MKRHYQMAHCGPCEYLGDLVYGWYERVRGMEELFVAARIEPRDGAPGRVAR